MMDHPLLLNDIMFKIVFGTQENERLLRALINALLGFSGKNRIQHLDIVNPVNDKTHLAERGVILDLKAVDGRQRYFNIEVQVRSVSRYVDRVVYYWATLLKSQLDRGNPYTRLVPTISISILDFNLFEDLADLHSIYRLYDVEHQRTLSDILELHFVELPKFRQVDPVQLHTAFDKWLYALKFGERYDNAEALPETLREEEGIAMALDKMRKAFAIDEVRDLMEAHEKWEHDQATRLETAVEEAVERTREEAHVGRVQAARRLVAKGLSPEEVGEILGLDPSEFKD